MTIESPRRDEGALRKDDVLLGPAEIIKDLADRLEGAKELIDALSEMYGFSVEDDGLEESIERARMIEVTCLFPQ